MQMINDLKTTACFMYYMSKNDYTILNIIELTEDCSTNIGIDSLAVYNMYKLKHFL